MTHALKHEPCGVCGDPLAGEMYVHAQCHMASPVWMVIEQHRGTMRVECAECGALVLRLPMQALAEPA